MAITETTFGPKNYLTLRKSISTDQVSDKQMYDDAGKMLAAYMESNLLESSGPWTVLYFSWDEANKKTEIGISYPVEKLKAVNDPAFTITEVPAMKAAMEVLQGPYDGLKKIHQELMAYVKEKNYTGTNLPVVAIEEYEISSMEESDQSKWKTNIYYPHA